MFADAHIHLFQHGFHGNLSEHHEVLAYEGFRERFGIQSALVVGYEGQERFRGNNEYLRHLAPRHPWMAPLRYVGSSSGPVDELDPEFCGYALYLDDWPRSRELAATLQERALATLGTPIVSINCTPESLAEAAESLLGFDACNVLISHFGLPGRVAASRADAVSRMQPIMSLAEKLNVYVKLSAAYAIDSSPDGAGAVSYVEVLLEGLGADRLVWGSDFAPALDHHTVEVAFSLPGALSDLFTPSEADQVCRSNLLRLLGH
jgi:hypothetical protein